MSTISGALSLRFASPFSSEELFSKVEESVPEKTSTNTKWAVQEWVAERSRVTPDDIPVSLTDATNQQLSGSHCSLQKLGIPAGLGIIFVTGHRSIDGMRSYKMISERGQNSSI